MHHVVSTCEWVRSKEGGKGERREGRPTWYLIVQLLRRSRISDNELTVIRPIQVSNETRRPFTGPNPLVSVTNIININKIVIRADSKIMSIG